MKNKNTFSQILNSFKWLVGIVLILISALANSYFGQEPLLYRLIGIIFLVIMALFIISSTEQGASAFKIIIDSRTEIRRVVWPTRSETTSTSFVVIGVVTIAGLLLWGLDSLFSWATANILG
jgi:preprotein translocase subunit SecE